MSCIYKYKGRSYTEDEFKSFVKEEFIKKSPKNKFLSILEKDANWVTFFVKSIIADSAKKGYEKVIFPKGDTANKVEGQETLENFINRREELIKDRQELVDRIENVQSFRYNDRFYDASNYIIDKLSLADWTFSQEYYRLNNIAPNRARTSEEQIELERLYKISYNEYKNALDNGLSKEEYIQVSRKVLDKVKPELNQFKKEIEEAKSGKAKFAAINRFYEQDIFNILKKQGYSPIQATDEHGNGWWQVEIKPDYENLFIFPKPDPPNRTFIIASGHPTIEVEKKNECK